MQAPPSAAATAGTKTEPPSTGVDPAASIAACIGAAPPELPAAPVRAACAEAIRAGAPGLALASARDGRTATLAFGRACATPPRPVTVHTRFRIGSITKMLVGLAAVSAEAEGRIDLDTAIEHIAPDLRIEPPMPPVTTRALLTHTAGIVDRPPRPSDGPRPPFELGPFARRPATGPAYSNTGFALGAWVLARALGHDDVHGLFAEPVLAPLVGRAVLADGRAMEGACGHLVEGGTVTGEFTLAEDYARFAHGAAWVAPAGALAVAPADLARFLSDLPADAVRRWTARSIRDPAGGPAWIPGARLAGGDGRPARIVMTGRTGTFWALAVYEPASRRAWVVAVNAGTPLLATKKAIFDALDLRDEATGAVAGSTVPGPHSPAP